MNTKSDYQIKQDINSLFNSLFIEVKTDILNLEKVNYVSLIEDDCDVSCVPCDNFPYLEIGFHNNSFDYNLGNYITSIIKESNAVDEMLNYLTSSHNISKVYSEKEASKIYNRLSKDALAEIIVKLQNNSKDIDKIIGGCEIKNQHDDAGPGTLGIVVKDRKDKIYYILSALHVLYGNRCYKTDCEESSIQMYLNGEIHNIAENFLSEAQIKQIKHLDVALSRINEEYIDLVEPGVLKIGLVNNDLSVAKTCDKLIKYGASTRDTNGHIRSTTCDYKYQENGLPDYELKLENSILMSNRSKGGDSGSLVLEKNTKKVVGVLVAGDEFTHSVAVDINSVIKAFKNINIEFDFNF
ncbi:hypothetical protein [uncultured Winogradskyella sp.]|uniref:hypothetical protein n=1 Tax=uncultured Winogradskyella sp. TaxID=395353 RepID=UPI00261EFBB1|nr:hypothetical protein [uncultured Winogradskyella sp.]